MKQVFQADDGKIFETQAECEKYETRTVLFNFVDREIWPPHNDDFGSHVIRTDDVVDFIEEHYEKIGEILGKAKTEDTDGWIINTQTFPRRPSTLSDEDVIEVEMSNGGTHIAMSYAWDASWNVNDVFRYIVKYRKVTNCQLKD